MKLAKWRRVLQSLDRTTSALLDTFEAKRGEFKTRDKANGRTSNDAFVIDRRRRLDQPQRVQRLALVSPCRRSRRYAHLDQCRRFDLGQLP
jgi:hypothetical protein